MIFSLNGNYQAPIPIRSPIRSRLGRHLGATSLNEVAKRYGRDQVSLSLGIKRLEQEIVQDGDLR